MTEERPTWPALQKGELIEVFNPDHPHEGQEIGLVLEDTPEGKAVRFLNIGGTTFQSATVIGATSWPQREQSVRRIIDRDAAAPAMKRLAAKLGPLVGRTFPELWDGEEE